MSMKIRKNLLPKGFKAINIFGIVIIRKDVTFTEVDENHEDIHTAQIIEVLSALLLPFIGISIIFTWKSFFLWIFSYYIWYLIEYSINLLKGQSKNRAYRNISFEKEAYSNQDNLGYLKNRRILNFLKYIK